MKNKVADIGAVISMFVCIAGEIVFSGAMKSVFTVAGNSTFLCFLVSGVTLVALSALAKKIKSSAVVSVVSTVYLLVVVSRLTASMVLFQSQGIIVAVLTAFALLSLLSFGVSLRGASIFTAVCFVVISVVFVLCAVLGVGEYQVSNIMPVFNKGVSGFVVGCLMAFSVLSPLVLPLLVVDSKRNKMGIVTLSACCCGVVVSAIFGTFAFGETAGQYQSVISEISKNVNFGKFFQRLEGLSDAVYILSATATVVLLSAMVGNVCVKKSKRPLAIFGTILIALFAVAFLSVKFKLAYNVVQTVSVAFGALLLLLVPDLIKTKKILPITLALCTFVTFCSCSGVREIENSVYVVITACDSKGNINLITESGKGGQIYTVKAETLEEAKNKVETKHCIELSYSQMSGLLFDEFYNKINERIKEVINSSIPNSAVVYQYEGEIGDIYEDLVTNYDSAFDFVASLKLGHEERGTICASVSKINTHLNAYNRARVGVVNREGYVGIVSIEQ